MKQLFSLLAMSAVALGAYADNTITWGYCTDHSLDKLTTVGFGAKATYYVAMEVPCNEITNGSNIEAVNIPVLSKNYMSDFKVFFADADMNIIYCQEVDKKKLSNQKYNTITLDTVLTVSQPLFAGYTFGMNSTLTEDEQKPILLDGVKNYDNQSFLLFGAELGTTEFPELDDYEDNSADFGSLAMNLEMSNLNLPAFDITCGTFSANQTGIGKPRTFALTLTNTGKDNVENVEYELTVAGVKETRTAEVFIPCGFAQTGTLNVDITGPATVGDYEVSIAITKVNGQPNPSADQVVTSTFTNYERFAERHTTVEEFTGTGCGYCPRGLAGMDMLKELYPTRFIGIGLHLYNSSDPMYPTAGYPTLGMTGAPSCSIDRKMIVDPYNGIITSFELKNKELAEVDVELTATWADGITIDSEDIQVNLSATTTALQDDSYSIVFVLTADSLTDTSNTTWMQHNYYASDAPSGDPRMDIFCAGGTYGQASFYWRFNDVMISSSYKNTTNQAPELGALAADESKTIEYTLALPTKATLLNAIKRSIDNVYGVAIILNSAGKVANAARVHVEGSLSAIDQITVDPADLGITARYGIDGTVIGTSQKGFSIIRLSDGSVKKQFIR